MTFQSILAELQAQDHPSVMCKRRKTRSKVVRACTTDYLPSEIIGHIFTFLELQTRRNSVPQVCKIWREIEATIPQRPSSIHYDGSKSGTSTALRWLVQKGFETDRLKTVTLLSARRVQHDTASIHSLLTILAAKQSPVLSFYINGFESNPNVRLMEKLMLLNKLEKLVITSWQYDRNEAPLLVELSSLKGLQELRFYGVKPKAGMVDTGVDQRSGQSYLPLRQGLQSLTSLTWLVLSDVEPACRLFQSAGPFCTQLRNLKYSPGDSMDSHHNLGITDCLSSMPTLTTLSINCSPTVQQQLLSILHSLRTIAFENLVDYPVVFSPAATVSRLSLEMGLQGDLDHILPLPSLLNLVSLEIRGSRLQNKLPDCWSKLHCLNSLSLPRCKFLPISLASLPKLHIFAIRTHLGQDPLGAVGAESVLQLIQSLPHLRWCQVAVYAACDADAVKFKEEISRVQQQRADVKIQTNFRQHPF